MLQLLGDTAGDPMDATHAREILHQADSLNPISPEDQLLVEYSGEYGALARYELAGVEAGPAEVVVRLVPLQAACRPAQQGACGTSVKRTACCG